MPLRLPVFFGLVTDPDSASGWAIDEGTRGSGEEIYRSPCDETPTPLMRCVFGNIRRWLTFKWSRRAYCPCDCVNAARGSFETFGRVLSFSEHAVYVLHAFQKKTRQTPRADIELAARRYRMIGEEP